MSDWYEVVSVHHQSVILEVLVCSQCNQTSCPYEHLGQSVLYVSIVSQWYWALEYRDTIISYL